MAPYPSLLIFDGLLINKLIIAFLRGELLLVLFLIMLVFLLWQVVKRFNVVSKLVIGHDESICLLGVLNAVRVVVVLGRC